MRRWIKRITIVVSLLFVAGLVLTWWAVEQTQHVPEFYAHASDRLPESTVKASQHLEAEVEQLQSQVARQGSWNASFSVPEVNAWLIEELPRKFPKWLAKGASEPRIAIEDGRLLAAARYKDRRIDTVISCELEVELTEQPNMLALRINKLRAGALPLPLSKFAIGISKEAAKGGIDIRWDVTETGPVALVSVPSEHPEYVLSPVIVESIQLIDGTLELSGHTGPLAHETYRPNGPVHRFVSYRPGSKRKRQTASLPSSGKSSEGKLR